MSLMRTIEKLCDVFRETEVSSQDGRIACWQVIVASLANDFGGDMDAAKSHLAKETLIALKQLRKICAGLSAQAQPGDTIQ